MAAVGSGEFYLWLREFLFGKKNPEASLREISSTMDENGPRGASLALNRLFTDAIYVGGVGALGDWLDYGRSSFREGSLRAKSPLDPVGLGPFYNLRDNIILPLVEQKTLTGRDLANWVKNELPVLNYSQSAGLRVAAAAGMEFDAHKIQDARADISQARRAWGRFLDENELQRRQKGRMSKTPMTPLYSALSDALLAGDAKTAKELLAEQMEGKTPAEKKALLKKIQSSINLRDPLQFGEYSELRGDFVKWLRKRDPEVLNALLQTEETYRSTVKKAGLKPTPHETDLKRALLKKAISE
jgi:hypothetical protein